MNPELLLNHFDRISDAPDAIPQLRSFILDLAVRGKIVEQDSKDKPASELFKSIQAAKARLVKDGRVRKQIAQPDIEPASCPFLLPKGWIWARLGDVIQLLSGQHLQPGEYSEQKGGDLPYITGPADFGKNGLVITRYALVKKAIATKGQILLTVKGAGVGKTAICDLPKVAISRQLMAMTAIEWSQQFLLLTTHRLATALIESARSLIPGISREDVDQFIFPLPPLLEQARIVAKVDKLMALCDRLEAARAERESRRDRLTVASIHYLNDGARTEVSEEPANFCLNHLTHLTARPDQMKQIRQALLSLAIRGRLVPQDPSDESASELLKRIQAEKAQLLKEERIHNPPQSLSVASNETPYSVPADWKWVRLSAILASSFYGPRFGADEYSNEGTPTIRTTDMTADGRIVLRNPPKVLVPVNRLREYRCEKGDLLITRTGSIGTMAVFDSDYVAIPSAYLIRLRFTAGTCVDYIHIALRSPYGQAALGLNTTKVAQPNINARNLAAIPVALPPLAEQHRVVAKVNELMALCNQLEAQLTTAKTETSRLLEAVLHHALNDSHLEIDMSSAVLA